MNRKHKDNKLRRAIKFALSILILIAAWAIGLWQGANRATSVYDRQFFSDFLTNEYHEARHDFQMVDLLTQKKFDNALELAQYRHYSRLILAWEAAQKPEQPEHLRNSLRDAIRDAKKFEKAHPYKFQVIADQNKWESLPAATESQ